MRVRRGFAYLNGNPSRVKLAPDGVVEEYAVSPPPFVKRQTITLNIPNTMNEFDHIIESFAGASGGSSVIIPVTPLPTTRPRPAAGALAGIPLIPVPAPTRPRPAAGHLAGIPSPISVPNIVRTPPVGEVAPPIIIPPIGGGGGGGGGGGSKEEEKAQEGGAVAGKLNFIDDLKEHAVFYGVGTLAGGGAGYFIGNKYNNKWLGTGVGAVALFGLAWLYFNKFQKPSTEKAPSGKPASEEAQSSNAGGGQDKILINW